VTSWDETNETELARCGAREEKAKTRASVAAQAAGKAAHKKVLTMGPFWVE
jgi:hypothetical protein